MGQRWDIKRANCTINSLLQDLFQKYIRFRMSSPWRKRVLNLETCRLFALRCSLTALTSWQAVCLDRLDPDTNAVGEMDEKIQEQRFSRTDSTLAVSPSAMHPSTSHALFGESDSEITQVTEHFLSFRTHARAPAGFATLSEGAIWRLKLLKEVARNFELGFPGTYVYFVRFVVQGRLHAVSQYFNTREKLLSKHFGMEHHLMESLALRVSSRRRPEMGPISCPTLLPSFLISPSLLFSPIHGATSHSLTPKGSASSARCVPYVVPVRRHFCHRKDLCQLARDQRLGVRISIGGAQKQRRSWQLRVTRVATLFSMELLG